MAGFAAGLKAFTDRSRSDCVHEQVAKLGPVSRAAGMDCECPLYAEGQIENRNRKKIETERYEDMRWNKFTLKTKTDAEDIVISALADAGVEGVEIEDKVPLPVVFVFETPAAIMFAVASVYASVPFCTCFSTSDQNHFSSSAATFFFFL